MSAPAIQTKRWTRQEYDRMAEAGILSPEDRVQLIDGDIVTRTPRHSPHSAAIGLADAALRQAFGSAYWIRIQLPLIVDPDSEPEPDLAVVSGAPRDYVKEHPRSTLLVIEVADTTLSLDRDRKARIYARANIPEYWIVNLNDLRHGRFRQHTAHPVGFRVLDPRHSQQPFQRHFDRLLALSDGPMKVASF